MGSLATMPISLLPPGATRSAHGNIAPIDAAAASFKVHEDAQLRRLAAADAIESVRRRPLALWIDQVGDPLEVAARVLDRPGASELEVTEVTLHHPLHSLVILNSYFDGSPSSRPFHDAYIHPPGSSTLRYFPLQVLLAAVYANAKSPVDVQLTARESTLDEVRDMVAREVTARPLCVPPPCSELEPFDVHGALVDGYRMTLHDLSHLIVLTQRPPQRPREAVALYDALHATLDEVPPPEARKHWCHELLDHLLSGYAGLHETITYAEQQLADADRGPHGAWARKVSAGFRRRATRHGDH